MCLQVLDSPFGRLKDLMVELCEEQKLPIPRAFMRIALSMMRRSVRKRANFNVDDVSPLDVVPGSFIPALFGEDDFTKHLHAGRSCSSRVLNVPRQRCMQEAFAVLATFDSGGVQLWCLPAYSLC